MKDGNGINLCSAYQPTYRVASYSAGMDINVGIVGWIYRTKIDPISILHPSLLFLAMVHSFYGIGGSL